MSINRPIIAPEPCNGEGNFTNWLEHFEGVTRLNKWKEKTKWLQVRLTRRAQAAYKQLKPKTWEGSFNGLVEALHQRFELDSRRELYAAEFQTRRKKKLESWADSGDSICALIGGQGAPEPWGRWETTACPAPLPCKLVQPLSRVCSAPEAHHSRRYSSSHPEGRIYPGTCRLTG